MSEFSPKPEWTKWVYCTKCKLYTVPRLQIVEANDSNEPHFPAF